MPNTQKFRGWAFECVVIEGDGIEVCLRRHLHSSKKSFEKYNLERLSFLMNGSFTVIDFVAIFLSWPMVKFLVVDPLIVRTISESAGLDTAKPLPYGFFVAAGEGEVLVLADACDAPPIKIAPIKNAADAFFMSASLNYR